MTEMDDNSYMMIEQILNAIFIAIAMFVVYYTISYMHEAMGFLQNLQINTRILLAQLPFGILITAICQTILKILYSMGYNTEVDFPHLHTFIWYFADFGAALRIGTSSCLLAERVIASINVDRYEYYCIRIPYIAIITIVVEVLLATIICIMLKLSTTIFPRFIGGFIGMIFVICSLIIFLVLPRWSLTIYNRYLMINQARLPPRRGHRYPSLSQRFQSCENLRVSKFLRQLISLEWAFGATVIVIHIGAKMHPYKDHPHYIYLTFAYAWIMIWTVVTIAFIRRRIKLLKEVSRPGTMDSNKVGIDPEAINNTYFEMYAKDWK